MRRCIAAHARPVAAETRAEGPQAVVVGQRRGRASEGRDGVGKSIGASSPSQGHSLAAFPGESVVITHQKAVDLRTARCEGANGRSQTPPLAQAATTGTPARKQGDTSERAVRATPGVGPWAAVRGDAAAASVLRVRGVPPRPVLVLALDAQARLDAALGAQDDAGVDRLSVCAHFRPDVPARGTQARGGHAFCRR
ncbi:hypothetical protein PsYK624_132690 [Phanerochaete sordida]|uniref:Uncharacterized protein n=1 Tax=Phanerochaete sordida TaxID=48140 RepID=A0A9P3LJV3_9APHY|nr:hypothetical protein PsYK624_132690 [Phanerochaete sordida]